MILPYLTNSMKQSPSGVAHSHSASQDISCLLWNPKVGPLSCSQKPTICPYPKPSRPPRLNHRNNIW